jgi:hypothetical protein
VPAVHKRASAKRDLIEHYAYLAEHGGLETARSKDRRFAGPAVPTPNSAFCPSTLPSWWYSAKRS